MATTIEGATGMPNLPRLRVQVHTLASDTSIAARLGDMRPHFVRCRVDIAVAHES
jgi:hypothetical protein